jgi:acyl phosphate:glycerol-3-phosphate acyltransferase
MGGYLQYLLLPAAYLLGSISSAVLIARIMHLQDPRTVGSKNPGATNILRYGGKTAAALTLLGDLLKGVLAVAIARLVTGEPLVLASVGLLALVGHVYPVFFGFRGGKGVATSFGVWLALSPWVALALILTWLVAAALFRYSSLSALIATALCPLYVWLLLHPWPYVVLSIAMGALLIWRHRSNIGKLLAGKESRIGPKT